MMSGWGTSPRRDTARSVATRATTWRAPCRLTPGHWPPPRAWRWLRGDAPGLPILVSAALLLWPALWNHYPIVFDDTGTYISQAVHHYLGWDRPVFYSLFLLPLHLTVTLWPAIVVQALLVSVTLHLLRRVLLPDISPWWLLPFTAWLAAVTALPWVAAQIMPDLFTALLILALALLVFAPHRLTGTERIAMAALAAFAIAAHLSNVPLDLGLLLVLLALRRWLGDAVPLGRAGLLRLAVPPALAMVALASVNLAGHGRFSLSPYGNMFLLARVIYDGPGLDVLRRDCPAARWRLCAELDALPASSDGFLWRPDSPVVHAGGHKSVSSDADAIIGAALRAEPGTELRAWLRNGIAQLGEFATGDELHACPATVGRWIRHDFPAAESARFSASRQSHDALAVPGWLQAVHAVTAVCGIAGCAILVLLTHRHRAAGFAATVLLALVFNALIAGGLSTPHHRYGSRVVLLAPAVALLGGAAWLHDRRPRLRWGAAHPHGPGGMGQTA